MVTGLTRTEPKKCQHSNKMAGAYNHTIVNLCFSLCFLCHEYIGCKLNCLLNSVRQNLLRNLKSKYQPNQFKTPIITEKLSSQEKKQNLGTCLGIPWLGLVSLCQIWDFYGYSLSTLKYPIMGICYFFLCLCWWIKHACFFVPIGPLQVLTEVFRGVQTALLYRIG